VAKQFRVSLATVQLWLQRAGSQRLDRVDWSDRSPGRREPVNKTPKEMEDLVLTIRRELKEVSALGEYGAFACTVAEGENHGKNRGKRPDCTLAAVWPAGLRAV